METILNDTNELWVLLNSSYTLSNYHIDKTLKMSVKLEVCFESYTS